MILKGKKKINQLKKKSVNVLEASHLPGLTQEAGLS